MSALTKPHIRSNLAKPDQPQNATLGRNDADPARSSSPNIARRIDFQTVRSALAAELSAYSMNTLRLDTAPPGPTSYALTYILGP